MAAAIDGYCRQQLGGWRTDPEATTAQSFGAHLDRFGQEPRPVRRTALQRDNSTSTGDGYPHNTHELAT